MPASDKDSFNEEVNIFRLSDAMESYWRRYFANMTFDDLVASVALVRPGNPP